jgi:hypothetical protein
MVVSPVMPAHAGISGGSAKQLSVALVQAFRAIAGDPSFRWGDERRNGNARRTIPVLPQPHLAIARESH